MIARMGLHIAAQRNQLRSRRASARPTLICDLDETHCHLLHAQRFITVSIDLCGELFKGFPRGFDVEGLLLRLAENPA